MIDLAINPLKYDPASLLIYHVVDADVPTRIEYLTCDVVDGVSTRLITTGTIAVFANVEMLPTTPIHVLSLNTKHTNKRDAVLAQYENDP